jgi:hypothetical protein
MYKSEMPAIETRILNFVRGNNGFSSSQVSVQLNIPLLIVNEAVANLKRKGLLQNTSALKIGRKIG